MVTEYDDDAPDPVLAPLVAKLSDREPATDLWPGIHSRIRQAPAERRTLRISWPMALAASLTLIAGTATVTTLLNNNAEAGATNIPTASAGSSNVSAALPAGYATASVTLTRAIDRLEAILAQSSDQLDEQTRARITTSLGQLDQAIAATRNQVESTPGDLTAARHFTRALQRKLDVLEQVTTLVQRS